MNSQLFLISRRHLEKIPPATAGDSSMVRAKRFLQIKISNETGK
jgi:hypothetical protein